jgi:murein DD-endopeptidase MepM/ murein hydrolase activator NlpD
VEQGEVIYSDQLRGYGNMILIRHSGGIVSVYAHNQLNLVREGQPVARGEIIGRVGSTGRVTGPHLHFEIRKNNLAQDPLRYLPQLCCVQASDMLTPEG